MGTNLSPQPWKTCLNASICQSNNLKSFEICRQEMTENFSKSGLTSNKLFCNRVSFTLNCFYVVNYSMPELKWLPYTTDANIKFKNRSHLDNNKRRKNTRHRPVFFSFSRSLNIPPKDYNQPCIICLPVYHYLAYLKMYRGERLGQI